MTSDLEKYNWIVNPETNRKVDIIGPTGQHVMLNYLQHANNYYGGADSSESEDEDEDVSNHPAPLGKSSVHGRGKTQKQRNVTKAAVGVTALAALPVASAARQACQHHCTGNSAKDAEKDQKSGKKDKQRYENDADYRKSYDKSMAKEMSEDKD